MKEEVFYDNLMNEARGQETIPFDHSWEILESMLDEDSVKRRNLRRTMLAVAASFLIMITVVLTRRSNSPIYVEGPLAQVTEPEKTTWINKSPLEYDRLKDYDKRTGNNIRVVRNVNTHLRYADLVESTTRPHAFHPQDFESQMPAFGYRQHQINTRLLSGNWYLHLAEADFNKILKIDVSNALNLDIHTETIEPAQRFLKIPGQQRYFVKQSTNYDLVIIEILDEFTIILKRFNPVSNQFDEAIYLKKDIG